MERLGRILALVLGAAVCVSVLRRWDTLPWREIALLSVLAFLLRQRPVPLLHNAQGQVILSHVPGESVLVLLILRHGAAAATAASLLTNLLAFAWVWKRWWPQPHRRLGSISTIVFLPGLAWLTGWLYTALGGIPVLAPSDCGRVFQEPTAVLLPLMGALFISMEIVNRLYQGTMLHLGNSVPWQQAIGDFRLGLFEHLENLGALLALVLWTTWGWSTLPFALLVMEALLLSARARVQHAEARKQALSDPLTGLLSARGLSEVMERHQRTTAPFALLFLDMDRFKQVNDTYGHTIGDELLIRVAQTSRTHSRPDDLVARRGGDEFVVLLPDASRRAAEQHRETLRTALERALAPDPRFSEVSFSAGIALFPQDGQTEEALLDAADQAMYAEKRSRRRLAA